MTAGRIISIINHKGGVGKTTTAVSLGEALAREGLRVLVVDLDSQCNATDMLLPGRAFALSAFDVLNPAQGELRPEYCVQPTDIPGLDCLPNCHDSIYLEPGLIAMGPHGFRLFRERLQAFFRTAYDLTLIDNPPNLGTFVAGALLAWDYAIAPCDAGSLASLRGFSNALDFIEEIRENGNPDLRFLKGLVTRVDRRTSVWKTIIDEKTAEMSEDWVFRTVFPMSTDFQRAEHSGRTIFQVRPGAPGARAYRDLARELLAALGMAPCNS